MGLKYKHFPAACQLYFIRKEKFFEK